MDLLALTDFNAVASHGGFGAASRATGRSKATLSRHVRELEDGLGVRLIERGGQTLRLTEEGTQLYAQTETLLSDIAEVGQTIGEGAGRIRGTLRIGAPLLFAQIALGRIAAEFSAAHPDVRIEITADDRVADPVEDGLDLVIRINPTPDATLVGRCILRDAILVVAHPNFPRPVAGALVRAVMRLETPATIWTLPGGTKQQTLLPDPVLRLSSFFMIRDAVLAGAGAAILPESLAAPDIAAGRLVSWGATDAPPVEIWVLHTSRRLSSPKIQAFTQALREAYPDGRLRSGS